MDAIGQAIAGNPILPFGPNYSYQHSGWTKLSQNFIRSDYESRYDLKTQRD